MSSPVPAALILSAAITLERLAWQDERADGLQSEPDVEPDWNDPDHPGFGGADHWPEEGETNDA